MKERNRPNTTQLQNLFDKHALPTIHSFDRRTMSKYQLIFVSRLSVLQAVKKVILSYICPLI